MIKKDLNFGYATIEHSTACGEAVHMYTVAVHDQEGKLARMNHGDYVSELLTLFVFPDDLVLVSNNDADNHTCHFEEFIDDIGYDAQYPDADTVLQNILAWICDNFVYTDEEVGVPTDE